MTSPRDASPIASSKPLLVLASESPRRLQLLAQAGIAPDAVRAADIDESIHRKEEPRAYAARLARRRHASVARNGTARPRSSRLLIPSSCWEACCPRQWTAPRCECLKCCRPGASRATARGGAGTGRETPHTDGRDALDLRSPGRAGSRPMCVAARGCARPAAMPCRAGPKLSSPISAVLIPMLLGSPCAKQSPSFGVAAFRVSVRASLLPEHPLCRRTS